MTVRPELVDAGPATEQERAEIMELLLEQSRELRDVLLSATVTCPCGATRSLYLTTKCHFCGVYLCRRCADRHFGPAPERRCGIGPERSVEPGAVLDARGEPA